MAAEKNLEEFKERLDSTADHLFVPMTALHNVPMTQIALIDLSKSTRKDLIAGIAIQRDQQTKLEWNLALLHHQSALQKDISEKTLDAERERNFNCKKIKSRGHWNRRNRGRRN